MFFWLLCFLGKSLWAGACLMLLSGLFLYFALWHPTTSMLECLLTPDYKYAGVSSVVIVIWRFLFPEIEKILATILFKNLSTAFDFISASSTSWVLRFGLLNAFQMLKKYHLCPLIFFLLCVCLYYCLCFALHPWNWSSAGTSVNGAFWCPLFDWLWFSISSISVWFFFWCFNFLV